MLQKQKIPHTLRYPRNRAEAIKFVRYVQFLLIEARKENDKRGRCKQIRGIIFDVNKVISHLEQQEGDDSAEALLLIRTQLGRVIRIGQ